MRLLEVMKVYYRILLGALLVFGAVIFFKFLISGNASGLFDPQGPIALQERNLIVTMVLLMLIVVIPMFTLLFVFAWKYRAGNENAKYDPEQSYGAGKQLILWAIPAVLVAVLGTLAWNYAHALDPYKPIESSVKPITIQVVALPWKWLFVYPDQHIATINFVEFPENTPVHFELTADAPMSSFWIPQLGSQIYAMAAMQTNLDLIASTTGEFVGKDTEINGPGYARMKFVAKSVSQSDFDQWVDWMGQGVNGLDQVEYDKLAEPSQDNPVAYYSSVKEDLFNEIMMKFMSPNGETAPHMH